LIAMLFTATTTPSIDTLSLHDALPISAARRSQRGSAEDAARDRLQRPHPRLYRPGEAGRVPPVRLRSPHLQELRPARQDHQADRDRKSTRLNSSHLVISYAVFCLKKKI